MFQHTAARRRLAWAMARSCTFWGRFNTQPPEGGWGRRSQLCSRVRSFNTQPPEGGWPAVIPNRQAILVSTHSRPKAAGWIPLKPLPRE